MRIAIDIRKVNEFGVGTHVWNLVRNLAEIDPDNRYFLLGSRRQFHELGPLGENFEQIDVPEENSFWTSTLESRTASPRAVLTCFTSRITRPRSGFPADLS